MIKNISLICWALLTISCYQLSGQTEVLINFEKAVNTNIIANGVQWSAYPHADSKNAEWGMLMTDKKWKRVYDRLDYIKPGIIRVMDQAGWRYFKGVDENGNPIIDFDNDEVKALFKLLDYCQKNEIPVIFGEWGAPGYWNEPGNIDRADDPRWIHMISRYLDFLINDKGYTCIKYYNLVNEPNGDWASTNGDWEQWKTGVLMLADSIKSIGLDNQLAIIGSDAVVAYDNPASKYTGLQWMDETIKQLNDVMGAYDVHAYPDGEFVRSGEFGDYYGAIAKKVKKTGKRLLLCELGLKYSGELGKRNKALAAADPYASEGDSNMFVYEYFYGLDVADALIQSMNNCLEGAIAWDLDDAMHTNNDTGDKRKLKRWGMWNSLGTELCNNPDDENLRPWFYTWSLMCRYFPTGMSVVKTDIPKKSPVHLLAGIFEGKFSIAMVNNSEEDQEINVKSLQLSREQSFSTYIYQEENRKVDKSGFPVAVSKKKGNFEKGISLNVPAKTFILLTNWEVEK